MKIEELLQLLATARSEGWYQEDPDWRDIDQYLVDHGYGKWAGLRGTIFETLDPDE